VKSNLKEKRIFGVLTVCLSLLLLVGCTSTQSAKFKDAGCSELKDFRFDLAAQQFDLAAQNGDPEAVKAASNSRRMFFLMFYNPPDDSYEAMKNRLEEHLKCPVLSRYSNIENGILAQQTIKDKINFTLNVASYYFEILDIDNNTKLPYGKLGKIVVTDFYNKAMPLIRYDTGDMGIMNEVLIEGRKTLVLSHIEGRKLDRIYNTKGDLISSYIVYKNMWNYPEIEQYQFVQVSKEEYVFKISMKSKFKRENELINEFKSYVGLDADFKVEYVDEIPLLNSGKRKKVMNISK
jgi:phenylacetate-coenzyme A ligase PaaK-like adenylate-forming protein